uniref:Uncharacterized protein ycf33 n=1 Tax=Agarophyton chilense TaxID=2510777 RepID=A0A141SEW1_AGACH|nr:hypothetical protein Gchil_194 [Agarophyton chilense]AMK96829.1 hypothetical protein Gchil_194 [Agarophyton chilense]ASP44723.1 hypothetical protein [Agarophyton chilense]UAD84445.1 hypothetical protein [Agarophyton chilense]
MNEFWDNLKRFPRFLFSVIIGFFLTTFYTIFELLKEKNKRLTISSIMIIIILIIIIILRRMLGIN